MNVNTKQSGKPKKKSFLTGEEIEPDKEMSRSMQTAIIVGVMAFLGFLALGFSMAGPDPKFPRCELGFMGSADQACRSSEAIRHLERL